MSVIRDEIIEKAQSFQGIKSGVARLQDVLESPSCRVGLRGEWSASISDENCVTEWPEKMNSLLVLALHHPEDNLRLDWFDGGNTLGNKKLTQVCHSMAHWLQGTLGIQALPLPYHTEQGGIFLKDAATLAGIGTIGKNNLLLHKEWGPRLRLRALLFEGEFEPTALREDFSPCNNCGDLCHYACPQNAFFTGTYHRAKCIAQLNHDRSHKKPDREKGKDSWSRLVIKYCRACELACPVGT